MVAIPTAFQLDDATRYERVATPRDEILRLFHERAVKIKKYGPLLGMREPKTGYSLPR